MPVAQNGVSGMTLALRTSGDPMALLPAVKAAIWSVNKEQRLSGDVFTLEGYMDRLIAQRRFNMTLLAGLALCAALLAAVGVYGVVTYSVTRRTPEIGVRMALGADAGRTFRLVVFGALRVVLAGVGLGLAGAAAAGRSLRNLLFGVPPFDAPTFIAAAVAILVIGAGAAALPALRAARIDPVTALRQD